MHGHGHKYEMTFGLKNGDFKAIISQYFRCHLAVL